MTEYYRYLLENFETISVLRVLPLVNYMYFLVHVLCVFSVESFSLSNGFGQLSMGCILFALDRGFVKTELLSTKPSKCTLQVITLVQSSSFQLIQPKISEYFPRI